ncbi:MAG: PilW family protein [Burkholderiales bacterium]
MSPYTRRRRLSGVSLIELMVGMAIGLLAVLVITQVTTVFEARKRQTATGSDAQLNGALALHTLQRDVEMSGYGLTSGGVLGCTEIRGARSGTDYNRTMAAVLITQGSGASGTETGQADAIQLLMSSQSSFSLPMRLRENHTRQDTQFVLTERTNVGNRQGDLLLVVPNATAASSPSPSPTNQVSPNWCTLAMINTDPATTGDNLTHGTAGGAWNQDVGTTKFPGTLNNDVSYAAGSYVINLGTLIDRCYFVAGSNQRCGLVADSSESAYSLHQRTFSTTDGSTTNEELFANIVNLQATYGLDTNADGSVDSWTTTTPTTAAGWNQVLAVRIGVLSRASQYDQDEVTDAAPTWQPDGQSNLAFTLPPCPSGEATCWKHYRYRVFESVVPLRNMLWQARQS